MERPLDANAAWTPADAFAALDALRAFLPRVAAAVPEGRSIQRDVGGELKGVSWS